MVRYKIEGKERHQETEKEANVKLEYTNDGEVTVIINGFSVVTFTRTGRLVRHQFAAHASTGLVPESENERIAIYEEGDDE